MKQEVEKNQEIKKAIIQGSIPIITILIVEIIFGVLNGGIYSALNMYENSLMFSILITSKKEKIY